MRSGNLSPFRATIREVVVAQMILQRVFAAKRSQPLCAIANRLFILEMQIGTGCMSVLQNLGLGGLEGNSIRTERGDDNGRDTKTCWAMNHETLPVLDSWHRFYAMRGTNFSIDRPKNELPIVDDHPCRPAWHTFDRVPDLLGRKGTIGP